MDTLFTPVDIPPVHTGINQWIPCMTTDYLYNYVPLVWLSTIFNTNWAINVLHDNSYSRFWKELLNISVDNDFL